VSSCLPSISAGEVLCLIKTCSNRITLTNEDVVSGSALRSDLHNRGLHNTAYVVENVIAFFFFLGDSKFKLFYYLKRTFLYKMFSYMHLH